jgi:DnaJ domain
MAAPDFYALLEIAADAPADEVKRAFRQQIALYHPDKVQHLGKEFQAMAAERAAALTEAYRVLSHAERRAEYDRERAAGGAAAADADRARPAATAESDHGAASAHGARADRAEPAPPPNAQQFNQERASRDAVVRRAAMGRFRQALEAIAGEYEPAQAAGFDVACVPRSKLFARSKNPRVLGRFVPCVDGRAVSETWTRAGLWSGSDEACVFLMGSSVAPARELAAVIAEQRRKTRAKLTLIPIDARDWDAHVPVDAPSLAKTLLARLRNGT